MNMQADPETRAAIVLSFKGSPTIAHDGGTQSWRLDAKHIGTFNYVIVCRCTSKFEAEDDRLHKTAFFLGRVTEVVPSTEPHNDRARGGPKRWLFRISEAAALDIPDFWTFGRWPTVIRSLDEVGIDPADYTFQPLSDFLDADGQAAEAALPDATALAERAQRSVAEVIADHKATISSEIGVPVSSIDISIRF